jgi:hypothetical protein
MAGRGARKAEKSTCEVYITDKFASIDQSGDLLLSANETKALNDDSVYFLTWLHQNYEYEKPTI